MRKIKRPSIVVKPREVFYYLKRRKKLGDLTELAIEEVLAAQKLEKTVDAGCVFDTFSGQDLASFLGPWQEEPALNVAVANPRSLGVATLGDKGFEDLTFKDASGICRGWGELYLNKLMELAQDLMVQEASVEAMELGPLMILDAALGAEMWAFIEDRLKPGDKLGVKAIACGARGEQLQLVPLFTRTWLVPWLTKKDKKKLQSKPVF